MHRYRVWAPAVREVSVESDDVAYAMEAAGGGWWVADVAHATAGSRYGFSLDGGPLRPDPRSGSQPEGVEGASALVDHGSFAWSDESWRGVSLRGAVLYELHVGTFTPGGTFEAVIERLDHLVDLGVDAIELLPVAEFSGSRGWGYDGVDLFAPHHGYGGPEGLKRLVDACHHAGLGVVLDVVYNHLGPAGNYLAEFGPYFSERHRTNWGAAVNFDGPGSDEVRRFVLDNARQWLSDYHFDGLRLDAVHAIADDSALHILEEMAIEVDALATQLGRPLFLVAESDLNDPRFVRSRDAGGYGLEAAWADEWHHALHAALSGERAGYYEDFGSLELLAKALRQAWVYDGTYSPHRGRRHGRSPAGLSGHQFVVCTQNHDQVGNRALGERASSLMSEGRLRVAAALLLTGAFTPLLFQGEEWGATTPFQYFTDHADPELGRAVSEGRRHEFASFGWRPEDVPDPQDEATFLASRLDWEEPGRPPHAGLLAWYRRLLALRRAHPELSDPRLDSVQVWAEEKEGTLVMERGSLLLLVNLSEEPRRFLGGDVELLASSAAEVIADDGVVLPPDTVAIVEAPGVKTSSPVRETGPVSSEDRGEGTEPEVPGVRTFGWSNMFVSPAEDPRDPTPSVGERATLADFLTGYRQTLELKCRGLDATQLAMRSVPPSNLSLLGLVRHMADVERHWFKGILSSQSVERRYRTAEDPDGDFNGARPDPDLVEEAWAAWRDEVAFAEQCVAGFDDLGTEVPSGDGDKKIAVREVLVHMIEEYARHCGHADLLRERIDGRVGQ